jgi:transcriptional regulator with XRE-family HTH domain
MKQLCQEIEKIIELKGLKKIDIAKQIGVTPAAITKVLKGEATFELILAILKAVEPDHYLELLTKDDNLLKINTKNWRDTLEFASTNRLLDLQEKLVEKALNSDYKRDREFGMVYGVLLTWQDTSREFDEDMFNTCKRKVTCEYMSILLQLIDVNRYHAKGEFLIVDHLINDLKIKIKSLNECYMKFSLSTRMLELACHVELRVKNNVGNALKTAEQLIQNNIGKTFSAYGYYIKGLCLIESNINEAAESFEKSIQLYKEAGKFNNATEVRETFEFLCSYYDYDNQKNPSFNLTKCLDFYKQKNISQGIKLLSNIDENNPLRRNLKLFLKALLTNDEDKAMDSLIMFVNSGDKYFANLPRKWLLLNNSKYTPILNSIMK